MPAIGTRFPALLFAMLFGVLVFVAACSSSTPAATPTATTPEDTMAKEDESMSKEDESMAKTDESMAKEDESMAKDGESMAKDGEPMAKIDESMSKEDESMSKEDESMAVELPDKIRAPHFIGSYPTHGETLALAPEELVLNFNFNLHPTSSVELTRDGQPVLLGDVAISENELALRVSLPSDPGNGVYHVRYSACWPDASCHGGSIAFVVDSKAISEYRDLRGQMAVTVLMRDGIRFDPQQIIISPGTTVTWVNEDAAVHFVNTDPHPSHNLVAELNSTSIGPGESYSFTFDAPGAWGYHCSAHHNLGMTAQILVM